MPFVTISDTNNKLQTEQRRKILITDITLDHVGLVPLARSLQQIEKYNCPVDIWNDPEPAEEAFNLSDYAAQIAAEIIAEFDQQTYDLGGYSFGGSLGWLVAQHLCLQGKEVNLFIIDTVSIEASKDYLEQNNIPATEDLVAIFDYVRHLACLDAGYKLGDFTYTQAVLQQLSQFTFDEQINVLVKNLLNAAQNKLNKAENANETDAIQKLIFALKQRSQRVAQNLSSLRQVQSSETRQVRLPQIGVITSTSSNNKHKYNIANSWGSHCGKLVASQASNSNHVSLIRDPVQVAQTAERMLAYFTSCHQQSHAKPVILKMIESPTLSPLSVSSSSPSWLLPDFSLVNQRSASHSSIHSSSSSINTSNSTEGSPKDPNLNDDVQGFGEIQDIRMSFSPLGSGVRQKETTQIRESRSLISFPPPSLQTYQPNFSLFGNLNKPAKKPNSWPSSAPTTPKDQVQDFESSFSTIQASSSEPEAKHNNASFFMNPPPKPVHRTRRQEKDYDFRLLVKEIQTVDHEMTISNDNKDRSRGNHNG